MAYEPSKYTLGEEIANAVTHGVGAALGIAGLSVMTVAAAKHGAGRVVPCVIYGSFMVLMFLVSTLYHSLTPPRAKRVFRVLDHEMIFLMIAGTYTPMMLLGLGGAWGWSLFGVVWGLAVAGLVFQGVFTGRFKVASTIIYVLMGWVVVIAFKPLLERVPAAGIRWLCICSRRFRTTTRCGIWRCWGAPSATSSPSCGTCCRRMRGRGCRERGARLQAMRRVLPMAGGRAAGRGGHRSAGGVPGDGRGGVHRAAHEAGSRPSGAEFDRTAGDHAVRVSGRGGAVPGLSCASGAMPRVFARMARGGMPGAGRRIQPGVRSGRGGE